MHTRVYPRLPFRDDSKMKSFLIDSFSMSCAQFGVEADVNMNAVLNAPNIPLALTQMLKFGDYEDRINSLMSSNQISARIKVKNDKALGDAKLSIWSIIARLWLVQCTFVASNFEKGDYTIRASFLRQALQNQE